MKLLSARSISLDSTLWTIPNHLLNFSSIFMKEDFSLYFSKSAEKTNTEVDERQEELQDPLTQVLKLILSCLAEYFISILFLSVKWTV
jgi:hypothetical protein